MDCMPIGFYLGGGRRESATWSILPQEQKGSAEDSLRRFSDEAR